MSHSFGNMVVIVHSMLDSYVLTAWTRGTRDPSLSQVTVARMNLL